MTMIQGITFRLMQTVLFASFVLQMCQAKSQIQRDFVHRFLAEEDHDEGEEDHHDEEDEHDEHDEEDHDEEDHHDEHDEFGVNSVLDAHDDHDDDKDTPWTAVILATLLVNCAALVGLIILIPSIGRAHLFCLPWRTVRSTTEDIARAERKKFIRTHILDIGIPSFACGALMAAAVFLIIPESLTLITQAAEKGHDEHEEEGHDEHEGEGHRRYLEEDEHDEHEGEGEGVWKFGVAILAGLCHEEDSDCELCTLTDNGNKDKEDDIELNKVQDSDMCSDQFHDLHASSSPTKAVVASAILVTDDLDSNHDHSKAGTEHTHVHHHHDVKTRGPINYRLCASILLGDSFHNFADGIFIGAAFQLCGRDVAISIMLATLYHEIAQELADFFLLTRHANLQAHWALLFNFVSGLSATLGGLIILAFSLTNQAIGVILGVAGGVYIHVAASECVPRIELAVRDTKDRLMSLGWFCVGAVPIGLVLLNHQHCEAH
eukprot:scaffold59092_cov50-Attheya_sp.AAC.4